MKMSTSIVMPGSAKAAPQIKSSIVTSVFIIPSNVLLRFVRVSFAPTRCEHHQDTIPCRTSKFL